MIRPLLHLHRLLRWHSQTNYERVQTPRWRQVRERELRRCAARFKDAA